MSTEVCRSCGSELDEDDFCGHCGAQARCRVCQAPLKANRRFCGTCGTEIGQVATATAAAAPTPSVPVGMNSVEWRQDKTSVSLRAVFTDATASSLAAPLSAALGGHVGP